MSLLPETILQFGGGRFLRGFADLFVAQANAEGQEVGRIVVFQSTDSDRARKLNTQGGKYHVLVQGLWQGATVNRVETSASISRALVAQTQWAEVLELARSSHLRFVLSNTTEAGYALDVTDTPDSLPPQSFPARLLGILRARFESGGDGLTILPCELFENNADRLLRLVTGLAQSWNLSEELQEWIAGTCVWYNTLVDRIVTDAPSDHPLAASDALLTLAEPFALWVVQERVPGNAPLFHHPALVRTPDVMPYFLRKVRILNAAHTAMAYRAMARGHRLVREAIADPEIVDWLQRLLFEEILPVLGERVEGAEEFAWQTLERFANPFLEHRLSDIVLYHEQKVAVRLAPTQAEFLAKFGKAPPLLTEAMNYTKSV